jgi:NADP-dependent aldehyde dehydrogenase
LHSLSEATLEEENFGPSNIVVEATSKSEIPYANNLKGHLTATVLVPMLILKNTGFTFYSRKVGRIIIMATNRVEVCPSMVHGGPFPATTASQSTCGTNAIKRFARPICFQDYHKPYFLRRYKMIDLWRLVNGAFIK